MLDIPLGYFLFTVAKVSFSVYLFDQKHSIGLR